MNPLLESLAGWKSFSAIVVGDFMLDQLVHGDAERVAADAPVPILHVRGEADNRPGGAANVCLDLAALKGSVFALGVTGRDAIAEVLRTELEREGVHADGLVEDASRPTTLKQSLIGFAQGRHPQKMFRVDYESRDPVPADVTRRLLAAYDARLPSVDVVCIEDYAKGVCTPEVCQHVIRTARSAGKPVFVDPAKISDYSKYAGATCITPNRTEAEFATGRRTHAEGDGSASITHNAALARALMEPHGFEAVVLTLDRHGAMLLTCDAEPIAIPTIARQVYDVTGAGDMFLAGLAAARANGIAWDDSVRFANAAAGLEVEVFGVQPIPLEKIHHAIMAQASPSHAKIRTWEQVAAECEALRRQKKRVVFTNGCFDVLHAGHVSLLDRAAALGDFLVVGLNDDASIRRLKGAGRPVNTEQDRARVLGGLSSVGAVVVFSQDTPMDLIRCVKPDTLVKGADYTKDKVVGADFVESYGGRVVLVDLVAGKSTTATIAKMRGE
jgi:D-beta-D-heptose 7-phosphate kinase/D-beta-D-heptose 1-phosphate adenosyltransferase